MIKVGHETIQASLRSYIEDEREYAREEVRKERNFEIAVALIEKEFPINQIAEISHLDLNTVNQLRPGK